MEEQFPKFVEIIPALLLPLLQMGQEWYPISKNQMHTSEEHFLSSGVTPAAKTCSLNTNFLHILVFIQATKMIVALEKPFA